MRKMVFLTLLCALFVSLPLSAQRFGVKAGFNVAGLSGDYIIELKSLSGFRFGGFLTLDMAGGLQIQPEAYYTQKGASYEQNGMLWDVPFTMKGKLKLDYIEIPVLVKYVLKTGSLEPFFFAGPYFAFKASAKGEVAMNVGELGTETETEDLEDVKSTDYGVVVGAGLNLPLGQMTLIFDVRYTLGMTNISDVLDESVKNGVFSILAGIGF